MRGSTWARFALVLAALCAFAGLSIASPASAATMSCSKARQQYPLHGGSKGHPASCGQRVADLQWLLGGHRPNAFTKVKPTFRGKPNGLDGARTKAAVKAYKYRIGYPAKGQCGARRSAVTDTAAAYFVAILEGKKNRPTCWVAVAAKRLTTVEPGASKTALAIKALELSQLGVREQPDGSNRGPRISFTSHGFGPYQGSTGAFGAAWCASFQQWAFHARGVPYFADRSAGVLYIEDWARHHGYLNAKAKVGSLVAFLDDGGHIGYVIKIGGSGYWTVEGNEGNAVREVYHPWNDRLRVFIDLPHVA